MDDLAFAGASALLAKLRRREIGAEELLDHFLGRIARLNPAINAVVVTDFERGREAARAADRALAAREGGPLCGLPLTIKESIDVAGLPSTSGAPANVGRLAKHSAPAARALQEAGAVVFGKTNLPLYTADLQSYNAVYGTTNNPWDATRIPGGSSGGAAAALAAGLTPVEVGSDIGGSIRNPAHFCGVLGHKPSFDLVPLQGHVPGLQAGGDIAAIGPMARHAEDLELLLRLMAVPDEHKAIAWRVDLPAPRHDSLADVRVACWFDDPACPVDSETRRLLEELAQGLEAAGATLDRAARPAIGPSEAYENYYALLCAAFSAGFEGPIWDDLIATTEASNDERPSGRARFARHATQRHRDWLLAGEERVRIRRSWRAFFEDHDVLLCPVTPTAAFPHDHEPNFYKRRIVVDGEERSYLDNVFWCGLIGGAYLPATVAPIGLSGDGLPIGVQIVGPYLEDLTTIRFAGQIERITGGCQRPPGY